MAAVIGRYRYFSKIIPLHGLWLALAESLVFRIVLSNQCVVSMIITFKIALF